MSHGWNRGGEGITTQWDLFREMDDRFPSTVAVAACEGFALGDNCNMGQAWLRRGGVFAIGTGWSGNNNCRIPLQTRLLEDRSTVGEAARNEVVQYGDPSLRILPPKGQPLCALQVSPALAGHYEERTTTPGFPIKPLTQTYTLTNHSKASTRISVETDAPWITLSPAIATLLPNETKKVEATSNRRADALSTGLHVANIRFRRADGQLDDRRLALLLQPVSLSACYTFDSLEQDNHFPDLS
jgi:hypothetical protein